MRDLELWRVLGEGELEAGRVVPLLEALASIPAKHRIAFYGRLGPALAHEDARVRAAAVRALTGADGPLAYPAIVAALDDPSGDVRAEAVETLRACSAGQQARWVHALFHRDPDVRAAAVARPAPLGAEPWAFYLLADTACAEKVRDEIVVPANGLPAVIDFARRGVAGAEEARRWIADMEWHQTAVWLAGSHRRSHEEVSRVLDTGGLDRAGEDALDELLALFWDDDCDPAVRSRFFNKLTSALMSVGVPVRRRVVAAAALAAREHGWIPPAAELCVVFHPELLKWNLVPGGVRYDALAALYRAGTQLPRLTDDQVKELVELDLCRRPSGKLDLWAVGALLHFVRANPYQTLLGWFGEKEIVDAFAEDMERSANLLVLNDNSPKGRKHLIELLSVGSAERRAELLGMLTWFVRAGELGFLDRFDAKDVTAAARTLLALEHRSEAKPSASKLSEIANVLGQKIAAGDPEPFLREWLSYKSPETSPIGTGLLGVIARELGAEAFVAVVVGLDTFLLKRLVFALPYAPTVSYGAELALAHALVDHVSPAVRDWALARIPTEDGPRTRLRPKYAKAAELSPKQARRIAGCTEAELPEALAPCLAAPSRGLAAALAARPDPDRPCLEACVALLAAQDDPWDLCAQLERFGSRDEAFLASLDAAAVAAWQGMLSLSVVGHAVLHRFEAHAFTLAKILAAAEGGLGEALVGSLALPSPWITSEIWRGMGRVTSIWRWRDRAELEDMATEELLGILVAHLDTEVGEGAAKMLVAFHESRVAPDLCEPMREHVARVLPDVDDAVRDVLRPMIDSRGLPARSAPRRIARPPDESVLERIRASDDVEALAMWCSGEDEKIVHEATLRLIELGEAGTVRLAELLAEDPLPPRFAAIADSVTLWPEGKGLERIKRALVARVEDAELRFRLALAMVDRGERWWMKDAVEAVCEPDERHWFRLRDWERLEGLATNRTTLCLALAGSPHPHAYGGAVEHLLRIDDPEELVEQTHEALRLFLDAGTERVGELRRRAAWWLHRHGDMHGFPLLVYDAFHDAESHSRLLNGADGRLVDDLVEAVLVVGHRTASESTLLGMVRALPARSRARDHALERMLAEGENDGVRQQVVSIIERRFSRAVKLRRVADVFAWGTRIGRELSGRIFRCHMIGGQGLGYTRLNENRIYITPLPILRGDRHGEEIVEALVLHEIGHHLYHRGEEEAKVWKRAQEEGIGGLLNLVADEHLERNLRATEASFGDRLKRLAAYAFQHSAREIRVTTLFDMLQGRSFEVLSTVPLGVARHPECVRVDNGALLQEMERTGLRFARFVRALRMGLGNRHDDPLVQQGLDLFGKGFRKGDMQSLLDVSHRLRELFGWEVRICETFGGHESLGEDGSEGIIHGEGISDEEVQREVERVLDPQKSRSGASGGGGKLIVNVNPDERFDEITRVEKVLPDPARHREVVLEVGRHARHMRRYLAELGLSLVPQKHRLSGRRFDPGRAQAVVTRGDPRMLIARSTQITTDLFLGVIVDCSGSMHGQSMERAHAFGVLLAEAARGLPGIDLRLFGFTDRVIYDAGDAARPAVASLEADGGNNDAAALAYVAGVAKRSRRKAKLLVMISDGLPTECSVAALRGLVRQLTRREKMCCAQVAVRPLEEICFPHYVEIQDEQLDAAVRRFGTIVGGLVRKAMGA